MVNPNRPRKGMSIDKWTLVDELDQGGNGDVWIAEFAGEMVALKFLKEKFLKEGGNKKKISRFRTEIDFMKRNINRSGILPLIAFNMPERPSLELGERPWIATPFCTCLKDAQWQDFSLERVVRDVASLAQVLAELHNEEITHRDIKPENLFWLNGMAVLGDFGLVDMPDKPAVTEKREIMGPLFYVAPEMMHDAADISAKPADVYSLAKTLWVLATRQSHPIQGEQRMFQPHLTLSTYVNHPRARILDYVIDRGTRHRPEERLTMKELAGELRLWLEPPHSFSVETDLDWDAVSKVLRRERAMYDEECAQRQRESNNETIREIQNDLRVRMEQIMTKCSQRLDYGLGGGGSTQLVPASPNAKYIAQASVNLHTPREQHGVLVGWMGVQLDDANNLRIVGAIAVLHSDVSPDILWLTEATAELGSAIYDRAVTEIFQQLEAQFYLGIREYVRPI